jgi:pentatricopeptide repeat protein
VLLEQLGELRSIKEANKAISAWGRVREWERALKLLSEIRQRGLEPNVITYSAAISACEKGSQWERALELLSEMYAHGIEPSVVSFNAAMSACEKGGQWQHTIRLLSEMKHRGLEPTVVSHNVAISALARSGKMSAAIKLYEYAHAKGYYHHWLPSAPSEIDLHGCSSPVARVAVAFVLEEYRQRHRDAQTSLTVITGKGLHSEDSIAIVKPSIAAMLAEGSYVALNATEVGGNPGRLEIPQPALEDWVALSS